VGEGYQFAVLGDNHADVDMLVTEVRSRAEAEIARQGDRAPGRRARYRARSAGVGRESSQPHRGCIIDVSMDE